MTLLSGPLLGGAAPKGAAGAFAIAVVLVGLGATVAGAFSVMAERNALSFEVEMRNLALDDDGVLDDERRYYRVMLGRLMLLTEENADVLARLTQEITHMLWGILAMLCGLALAALVG